MIDQLVITLNLIPLGNLKCELFTIIEKFPKEFPKLRNNSAH